MIQDGSLDFKLVQRVCLLQQALDQALGSLEELRAQVQDRQWLESQLAQTEKYANVQQKAIAYLKTQLTQASDTQRQLLQAVLTCLEDLINSQQATVTRLQVQIQQGETELQTYLRQVKPHRPSFHATAPEPPNSLLELEMEVMVARSVAVNLSSQLQAVRHSLQTLATTLSYHHTSVAQLTTAIRSMLADLVEPSDSAIPLLVCHSATLDFPGSELDALRHTLRMQQVQIQELETALRDHLGQQTHLAHRCQSLAAERDHYRRQLEQLQQTLASHATLEEPRGRTIADSPPRPLPRRLRPSSPIQPLQVREGDA
jgi:chromosome segregation ATPase